MTGPDGARWTEQTVDVDGAELHVEVAGDGPPLVLVHGLGSAGALWNRVCDALGAGLSARRASTSAAAGALARARARELSLGALGRRPRRACSTRSSSSGRCSSGTRSAARVALRLALERPDAVRALVLIGTEADLVEPGAAHARLGGADRARGARGLGRRASGRRTRRSRAASLERDPSILDEYRDLLLRERPGRLRPPVPRDRGRREPLRPARRGRPAGARPRRRPRRPHAARARPRSSRPALAERRGSSSCRTSGTRSRSRRPQATAEAIERSSRERRRPARATAVRGCSAPTRRRAELARGARSATSTSAGSSAPTRARR